MSMESSQRAVLQVPSSQYSPQTQSFAPAQNLLLPSRDGVFGLQKKLPLPSLVWRLNLKGEVRDLDLIFRNVCSVSTSVYACPLEAVVFGYRSEILHHHLVRSFDRPAVRYTPNRHHKYIFPGNMVGLGPDRVSCIFWQLLSAPLKAYFVLLKHVKIHSKWRARG